MIASLTRMCFCFGQTCLLLFRNFSLIFILLLFHLGLLQLGDFGISKSLSEKHELAQTCIGTPYYMSPELFRGKAYSFKSDVWSLGICLYELCMLRPPFEAPSIHALSQKVCNGVFPPLSAGYSESLRTLIKDMLCVSPQARISLRQILSQKFLKKFIKKYIKTIVCPSHHIS